jgi:hypothetical protein
VTRWIARAAVHRCLRQQSASQPRRFRPIAINADNVTGESTKGRRDVDIAYIEMLLNLRIGQPCALPTWVTALFGLIRDWHDGQPQFSVAQGRGERWIRRSHSASDVEL